MGLSAAARFKPDKDRLLNLAMCEIGLDCAGAGVPTRSSMQFAVKLAFNPESTRRLGYAHGSLSRLPSLPPVISTSAKSQPSSH